jgi:transposase
MDEGALERALFAGPAATRETTRPVPAWADVHRELKRKGVTLALLWQEYKEGSAGGLQYSRYCDLYRAWKGRLALSMRQDHRAGEATFVDDCGPTVEVRDGSTGEARRAAIFVAVLGASSYTYVEATWSQGLEDWIGSHVRAFEFFGGVTELVVSHYVPRNIADRDDVTRAEGDLTALEGRPEDLCCHVAQQLVVACGVEKAEVGDELRRCPSLNQGLEPPGPLRAIR